LGLANIILHFDLYLWHEQERELQIEGLKRGAEMCINESKSVRSVAGEFEICHVSLNRYVNKLNASKLGQSSPPKCGYQPHTRVFNSAQETLLSNYLKNCSDMYFGLSTGDVRKLAFEFASKLNIKVPLYWIQNESAGKHWFSNFLNCQFANQRPQVFQKR